MKQPKVKLTLNNSTKYTANLQNLNPKKLKKTETRSSPTTLKSLLLQQSNQVAFDGDWESSTKRWVAYDVVILDSFLQDLKLERQPFSQVKSPGSSIKYLNR